MPRYLKTESRNVNNILLQIIMNNYIKSTSALVAIYRKQIKFELVSLHTRFGKLSTKGVFTFSLFHVWYVIKPLSIKAVYFCSVINTYALFRVYCLFLHNLNFINVITIESFGNNWICKSFSFFAAGGNPKWQLFSLALARPFGWKFNAGVRYPWVIRVQYHRCVLCNPLLDLTNDLQLHRKRG